MSPTGLAVRRPAIEIAVSPEDAVDLLAGFGADGAYLAGGTGLMRHPAPPATWIALHRLAELRGASAGDRHRWGASSTHTELARLPLPPALRALGTAARISAFPQVRNVATLGGNLSARGFAEADLVPALLVLDAQASIVTPTGRSSQPLSDYLAAPAGPALLIAVDAPAPVDRVSGYGRCIVRGAGEYPISCVAVSARLDADGIAHDVQVAIGAVEARARRVPEAEAALTGTRLEDAAVRAAADAAGAVLHPRDDALAPGWYRVRVLSTVIGRAVSDLRRPG